MKSPRTRHTATARARLFAPDDILRALRASDERLADARVAGILAARRAGESLPHTAAAEIDEVRVSFEWDEDGLLIEAHLACFARSTPAARALLCVTTCAATIVDAFSEYAEDIRLQDARITNVSGGSRGLTYDFDPPVRAAVLVVSDAVVEGRKEDSAGQVVRRSLEGLEDYGVTLAARELVGDNRERIAQTIEDWVDDGVDLILTVGGTGLAHTDTTVEAVEPLIDRAIPGLMEDVRAHGREQTPLAYISRGVAGLAGDSLIVTLPGSTSGATEAIEAIFPSVLHVFRVLRKSRTHLLGESE
jgi:molybdenum cofactor synthesis domain-containing protein